MPVLIEPIDALAFDVNASKGVFALLLGSGISRSAKIPTGWEITLDLVRQVATLSGEDAGHDPAGWFESKFGKQPSYSELLDQLSTTPSQRQALIKRYLEPTEEERQRGHKGPTAAHRAIAGLMESGVIQVVVTTNFDRLLETALAERQVHATVISTPDQIQGAVPLVHAGPFIIKVHGDYLDTRIRNTDEELAGYDEPTNTLLDKVFEDYGLIVCGWSADWDTALVAAIDRTTSRRYPIYWATRGAPSTGGAAVIARRRAKVINIEGADSFFTDLAEKVRVIDTLHRPHPLSAALAVAMLKEYMPEPRHAIRLHDLITSERNRVLVQLNSRQIPTQAHTPDVLVNQIQWYESNLSVLLPMAYHAGVWSTVQQAEIWISTIADFARRKKGLSGYTHLINVVAYPASLLMHAYLLGAITGQHYEEFAAISCAPCETGDTSTTAAIVNADGLNASIFIGDQRTFMHLPGYESRTQAVSERIANLLWPIASLEHPSRESFDYAFAKLELALAFGYLERHLRHSGVHEFFAPLGRNLHMRELRARIVSEWTAEHQAQRGPTPLGVMARLKEPPQFEKLTAYANRVMF